MKLQELKKLADDVLTLSRCLDREDLYPYIHSYLTDEERKILTDTKLELGRKRLSIMRERLHKAYKVLEDI